MLQFGGPRTYHSHFQSSYLLNKAYYTVVTDQSCNGGSQTDMFNLTTYYASHEFTEAITDPNIEEPTDLDNEGWDSQRWGCCEISDQCEDIAPQYATLHMNHATPEIPDYSYRVAKSISNDLRIKDPANDCVIQKAPSTLDVFWRNNTLPRNAMWFLSGAAVLSHFALPDQPTNWSYLATGDFNGDGYSDVLWRDPSSNTYQIWWLQTGTRIGSYSFAGPTSTYTFKGAADLDGNGISDLVFLNTSTGQVLVWMMNPDGTVLRSTVVGTAGARWSLLGAGDFDHSRNASLLWKNGSSLVLWTMRGDVIWNRRTPFGGATPTNLGFLGVGDLNGDGVSDVAWRDNTSGKAIAWLATSGGGALLGTFTYSSIPGTYNVAGLGDIDGDGVPDLLWRDSSDYSLIAWFLGSNGVIKSTTLIGATTRGPKFGGSRDLHWLPVGLGSFD